MNQKQRETWQRQLGDSAASSAALLAAAQAQAEAAQTHCSQMTEQLQAISDHSTALHLQVCPACPLVCMRQSNQRRMDLASRQDVQTDYSFLP